MNIQPLQGMDYAQYHQLLNHLGHVKETSQTPRNSTRRATSQGDKNDDRVDWCADQATWSIDNLPEVMYELDRPQNWLTEAELHPPPPKGYLVYGAVLRDIPILPDHISPKLEGWRYEYWCRLDRNEFTLEDFGSAVLQGLIDGL